MGHSKPEYDQGLEQKREKARDSEEYGQLVAGSVSQPRPDPSSRRQGKARVLKVGGTFF